MSAGCARMRRSRSGRPQAARRIKTMKDDGRGEKGGDESRQGSLRLDIRGVTKHPPAAELEPPRSHDGRTTCERPRASHQGRGRPWHLFAAARGRRRRRLSPSPALIEAAKGRQGRVLHGDGSSGGEKLGRLRGAVSGDPVRVERPGGALFQRVGQEYGRHPRRRRRQQLGRLARHHLEGDKVARAVRARRRRAALPGFARSRRHVRHVPRLLCVDRLQHQPGEAATPPRASRICSIRNGRARW